MQAIPNGNTIGSDGLTSDELQARAVALAWARAVGAKDGGGS